ncbi:hypothetical protein N4P33_28015 [Streptomyces sp. 15-116A]|uniref:hypothetical protein n=1 Tax=Streptomyces sp. 15-116A TaxID=2259035 RepID=UPI0021B30168|nr:hypothetical protein [Streptomyces sp. 15-116A]MCT7355968.1 hypothetical protein [Streptomyces sp. 15-116A]
MTSRTKTVMGSLLAGAAAVLFAAGPAAAGTDVYVDTTDPFNSAAAGFKADDEIFTVCDNRADGMRASGRIGWIDSKASHWIPLEDANGSGNSCARKNLEIPEGEKVTVQICVRNGANGDEKHCAIKHGKA